MKRLIDVVAALTRAGVDHVVVGGMAVVLHGHVRTTVDLDLVLDLTADNTSTALGVLTGMGLRPRLPVAVEDFADPVTRASWVADRHLVAFTLYDPDDALVEVDLFADPPIPYAELSRDALTVDVAGTPVRIASVEHLTTMKRLSGRTQDLADIEALAGLAADPSPPSPRTVRRDG